MRAKSFSPICALGDFDVAHGCLGADYPDPAMFLSVLASGTVSNYGHYTSPAYDALLLHAADLPDATERAAVLREAEALMLADQPIIPMFVDSVRNLVAETVHGWVANPPSISIPAATCPLTAPRPRRDSRARHHL